MDLLLLQGAGKAEFMSIRVKDVKISLSPGSIDWIGVALQSMAHQLGMEFIHVVHVKDDPSPPANRLVGGNKVEVAATNSKARKTGAFAAIQHIQSYQVSIEDHGASHVFNREGNSADTLNRQIFLLNEQH